MCRKEVSIASVTKKKRLLTFEGSAVRKCGGRCEGVDGACIGACGELRRPSTSERLLNRSDIAAGCGTQLTAGTFPREFQDTQSKMSYCYRTCKRFPKLSTGHSVPRRKQEKYLFPWRRQRRFYSAVSYQVTLSTCTMELWRQLLYFFFYHQEVLHLLGLYFIKTRYSPTKQPGVYSRFFLLRCSIFLVGLVINQIPLDLI